MQEGNKLSIPLAILAAGFLIAGAVFVTRDGLPDNALQGVRGTAGNEITIAPVTNADHILGNPAAPVVIVEYSDLECPFCKTFHATLNQILREYGTNGRVAWVFRPFPIAQLHSKAPKEAEAAECAAELGGNDAFWKFIDNVFTITPSNDGLDPSQLPKIAGDIGLDSAAFMSCLSSGRYSAKVEHSYQEALAAGGTGTPYSIIIAGNQHIQVDGAQPYASVKSVIDSLLSAASSGTQAVPTLTPSR